MSRTLFPILGGTFDPIHFGHLRCGWEIAEWTGEPVRLMPARQPGHREPPVARAEDRWEMVKRAVGGFQDRLVACDREMQREGPTYSVDTLAAWREDEPDAGFCLIVGADAFGGLQRWKNWQRLARLTHFIVVGRPGPAKAWDPSLTAWVEANRALKLDELRDSDAGRVIFREITALDISATVIRTLIAGGRKPAFLTPQAVWQYIRDRHLYRPSRKPAAGPS